MRPRSTHALPTIAAAVAAAGGAVILATGTAAAAANVTVPLHDAHVGASAAEFASGSCEENETPSAGTVRWVFVLPHNDAGFVSLSLTFRAADGTTAAVSIPDATDAYPDAITSNGTSKAWVVLPAGWRLQGGSAVADGATRARFFNLTHTCVGAGGPTPTPSTPSSPDTSLYTSPDTSPSVTAPPDTPDNGGSTPGGTLSAGGSPSDDVSASPSPLPAVKPANEVTGGLPRTGTAITGLLMVGCAATAAGAWLRWRYRRRVAGIPPVSGA